MIKSDECTICSGIQADLRFVKEENGKQWLAIDALRNRLPVWATAVISLMTFLCGVLLTLALK